MEPGDCAWEMQAIGSPQAGEGTALNVAVAMLELSDFIPSPMGACNWAMLGLFKFVLRRASPGLPCERKDR